MVYQRDDLALSTYVKDDGDLWRICELFVMSSLHAGPGLQALVSLKERGLME